MRYLDERELPRPVQRVEHVWIPMSDGCRLAGRLWIPDDARNEAMPAVLEFIPYRKRDKTRRRDEITHTYLASHGYVCARVDLRGSGDSEGILLDEYVAQEQRDAIEVLRWLAAQPWCNGVTAMMGKSWGGFNALQVASLRPAGLGAVVAVAATDDRYADDVHYMGGCLLGDNLSWASTMFAYNACPPDPALVGDAWRGMWRDRLEHVDHWVDTWLRHQHRDDYWRHGSICEDYSAITVPVMAVSGWADGYSNAVFRMLEHLDVPRQGLIGPWSHRYPHMGAPGPAIGFLQEVVRWFDRWLKGLPNGVEHEPMLRAWMQDSVPPMTRYETRPGRWVAEDRWPSPNVEMRRLGLSPGRLHGLEAPAPARGELPEAELTVQSPLTLGMFAGKWCSYSATPDLPHDQREEDGGALLFDSDPLQQQLEILGSPLIELEVAADRPVAMVAARLSDVGPDDAVTRVTYGVLNLTHRDGHERPRPLEPGEIYRVSLQLNEVAAVFPAGHRVRVAISSSYWPLAWPPPEPVRLTVRTGSSCVSLPCRAAREEDLGLRPFGEPEGALPTPESVVEPVRHGSRVIHDLATNESTLEVVKDDGTRRLEDISLELTDSTAEWYRCTVADFSSLEGATHCVRAFRRDDWSVRTVTETRLTADSTHFRMRATLDAYEGDTRVDSQNWDRRIPRDLL